MATTNLNIRTDKEIKEKADKIFSELGLNMTTAINLFLRTTIRENGIPFALKLDVPNAVTVEAMNASEKGEDLFGPYESVSDLMEALNA